MERETDGDPILVQLAYPGRDVYAQIWRVEVGRLRLYLLDTNIQRNSQEDQDITDQLYGGDNETRLKVLKPVGEWNTFTVEVDGGNMDIKLNGSVVSTVRDCELTEGPIGFQSEGAEIHLRNIRIKEKK